jgi:predicted PurR-regulated permease PerM
LHGGENAVRSLPGGIDGTAGPRRVADVDIIMANASQPSSTFTQRALKWTIFLAATAGILYLCLLIVRPFLNVIAWSSVLVITFNPVQRWLVRKTARVSLSAFVCSVMVVVAFVIPLLFLTAVAVDQFAALGASLQQTFADKTGPMAWAPLRQAYEWLSERLGLDGAQIVAWVRQHEGELARLIAGYTLAAAQNVAGAVVSFVFIIFAMFLLFRDGDRIVAAIPDLLPFERARSEALLTRVRDVIYGSVHGVVIIAVVQGALCGGMFWILGIPSAALWGMVAVVTSVLPLVGAAGVWAPGAVYLAATGHWTRAIILAVFGAAVISTIDNFLRPRLVGGRVGLSELVMFFSLLGGLQVFGVLGIVLGPLLFAIAGAIVHVLGDPTSAPPSLRQSS